MAYKRKKAASGKKAPSKVTRKRKVRAVRGRRTKGTGVNVARTRNRARR